MKYVRWYDKNPNLKQVFDFIQELDKPFKDEIAKDIIQILVNDFGLNMDEKINNISKNYNFDCKRWYDNSIDLFSSFEIIKSLPVQTQDEIVKKIIDTIMYIYFNEGGEHGGK